MNDRPTALELLAAVRRFLETELVPEVIDARLRFQGLVAVNVLTIAARELEAGDIDLIWEWQWLSELFGWQESVPTTTATLRAAVGAANRRLCDRIRDGAFDEPQRFHDLAGQLRRVIERKLQITNPRYLATFAPSPDETAS
ncbi:MAG: hypothetical protein IT429_19275 [Gemmataceae bacterium]|nr:hypothetical protein [Gemmataceae bacterium]